MTEQATPPPVAGWHPDPENSSLQRYWDGSKWTNGTRRPPTAKGQLGMSQLVGAIVLGNLITAVIVMIFIAFVEANGGF